MAETFISGTDTTTYQLLVKLLKNQTGVINGNESVNVSISGSTGSTTFDSSTDITVASAGTQVQGSNVATPNGVLITAPDDNTGSVYIGGPGVTNASGSQVGMTLVPGGMTPFIFPIINLNQVWVNADTNGDRVGVLVL